MKDDNRAALTVLLIEDSPEEAALVKAVLRKNPKFSGRVVHCDRLERGILRLGEGGFDVALLDLSLPDSFGIETFRQLQAASPEIPVIVLTSMDDDKLALTAVAEGAQDYLVKRFLDGRILIRSIHYAIERHRAEEALRESEERYALAVEGVNDGLWDWDLRTHRLYLSPRWLEMLGCVDQPLLGQITDWFDRVHHEDLPTLRSALHAHFAADAVHFEHKHRMVRGDGRELWVLARGAAIRDEEGKVVRMAGSLADITARRQAEEQLLHDAFHDGLTGLANRALFTDRLAMAVARSRRGDSSNCAVLLLDLDRFKTITESLGHRVGDRVLIEFAGRLEAIIRPGDTVARLGGDEFAVLVNDVRETGDAVQVAERISRDLKSPFEIEGERVFATASIGIVVNNDDITSAEAMLRNADIAMYRAKAGGKARYEVYDRHMHETAVALLKMETDLRRALERSEFVMHYQPIVDLESGQIKGFEGLVRWNSPERGLVTPANFIAIAEETGLIVPLGWWVTEKACLQMRDWQIRYPMDPPLFISVNISGRLFMSDEVVPRIVHILEKAGLAPESLRLEVTENVVLDHGEEVMSKLKELRALGVQLSVDDFGTGYSSLSYLQRFQYDTLKIDRSFVSGMESMADSQTIVETILQLASSLGIGVIAEGVETAEQLDRLRRMDCPLGQGFWFAKPLDTVAAEQLLAGDAGWALGKQLTPLPG